MIKQGLIPLLLIFLVALVLMVIPMPVVFDMLRPDWVTLVLLYWVLALPHRVNIGTAFVLGVMCDVLLGSVMGVHAIGLSVVTYFAARHFQRIRNFSIPQQAIIVGVLVLVKRAVIFEVNVVLHAADFTWAYFWPVLTSMIFWLWLFPLLRKLRRQLAIS
ncbi:rod shape-determining protein MreD [Idiomarina tyrosinivorans]|nr:rod shape-determining protein MreD [Idiomarina tyrosinivorans]